MTSSPCQSLTTGGNQIEIDSLKVKVSDLTAELEMKNIEIANLRKECAAKAKEIEAGLDLQTEMKRKMVWGESERRRLHNEVQELKGGIRVFCRIRPLLGKEKDSGHINISSEGEVKIADKTCKKPNTHTFKFDK